MSLLSRLPAARCPALQLLAASRPAASQVRLAWTRYPERESRLVKRAPPPARRTKPATLPASLSGNDTPSQEPPAEPGVWDGTILLPRRDARASLKALLMKNDVLYVTRQIEMLNIFLGFEQSNKYAINNIAGEVLGYIVEEPRGFLQSIGRQVFRTHRPFRALVLDRDGAPILWMRRPFSFINSRMYVQHQKFDAEPQAFQDEHESSLETFGVVQQRWHLWRRKYDLYLKESSLLSGKNVGEDEVFNQFAAIDAGFLAWNFPIADEIQEIASVERNFRGFGRELFTDTGQYAIRFAPDLSLEENADIDPLEVRHLNLQERALVLALSINVDFDFFSRHSEGGGGGWWLPLMVILGGE